MTYKIGDRVRLVAEPFYHFEGEQIGGPSGDYAEPVPAPGMVGKITSGPDLDGDYCVAFDDPLQPFPRPVAEDCLAPEDAPVDDVEPPRVGRAAPACPAACRSRTVGPEAIEYAEILLCAIADGDRMARAEALYMLALAREVTGE